MGFHRGRIAPSVILLAAVGVTTLSTAAARQAKECKGNGEDESFYPTVNNSFPGNNVFQNERFKVDSNVYPGTVAKRLSVTTPALRAFPAYLAIVSILRASLHVVQARRHMAV